MIKLSRVFLGLTRVFWSRLCVAAGLALMVQGAEAAPSLPDVDPERVHKLMERFTAEPHPMGSSAQRKYAREVKKQLEGYGWEVELQSFSKPAPNLDSPVFGGSARLAPPKTDIEGENILAFRKGEEKCLFLLGGHYDTKFYPDIRFVGANDGGSSTVLKIELARVIAERSRLPGWKGTGRWQDCSLLFVFFDGEEAFLPDWNEAQQKIGLKDNLYGSRAFVRHVLKEGNKPEYKGMPISLVTIIDMIGHKEQKLFITAGSEEKHAKKLISSAKNVDISMVPLAIEDDHIPFAQIGLPFLHVIDWTNLKEWHTDKDTIEIISSQKIANFGQTLLAFLGEKR